MADYQSEHTGQAIDEAINRVILNHDDWDNAATVAEEAAQAAEAAQTSADAANIGLTGKADLSNITGRLKYVQAPKAILASMGSEIDNADGGQHMFTPSVGDIYYTSGNTLIVKTGSGSSDYQEVAIPTDVVFCNAQTNYCYRWTGSAWKKVSGGGGGLSDSIYNAIKNNVNALRSKVNDIINVVNGLAALAFTNGKPSSLPASTIGSFTWPENEGGGGGVTPASPSINVSSGGVIVSNNATINVGTLQSEDTIVTKTIAISGTNLEGNLTLALSNNANSRFSLSTYTLVHSNGSVNATITIYYTHSGTVNSDTTETALLTISGGGATSRTFTLSGTKKAAGSVVTNYTVTPNLTDLDLDAQSFSVESGGTFNGILSVPDEVTDKTLPSQVQVSGSYGNLTYSPLSGAILISNITSDITITATAAAVDPVTPGEGVNVTKTLRNCEISDNTVNGVLASGNDYEGTVAIDDATSNAGGSPAYVIPSNAASDAITVKIGNTPISGYTFNTSTNKLTIPASLITGDITIEVTAESPVTEDRGISSQGAKQTITETEDVGYNDVYIEIPKKVTQDDVEITHLRWMHYYNTARKTMRLVTKVSANGYEQMFTADRTCNSNDETVTNLVSGSTYNDFSIIKLDPVPNDPELTNMLCLLATFYIPQIANCYVKGYKNWADANNDNNGVMLFDGQYAETHPYQS